MIKGTEIILLDYDIPLTVEYEITTKGLKITSTKVLDKTVKLDKDNLEDLIDDLEIILADVTEIED